jgi:hydrogenase maturation protein HypF
MAAAIVEQATCIADHYGVDQVGLCGGVFQNRVLTRQAVDGLCAVGLPVYLPRALPCNDAALSFGQAAELAARETQDEN